MSLLLRGGLGRKLTTEEIDGNFVYLENLASSTASQGITFPYDGDSTFNGNMKINGGLNVNYKSLSFSYISNFNGDFGEIYRDGNWVSISSSVDLLGFMNNTQTLSLGIIEGTYSIGSVSFPYEATLNTVNSDDFFITESLSTLGLYSIYGYFINPSKNAYEFNLSNNSGEPYMQWRKINTLGEELEFTTDYYNDGFYIVSDVSKNNSSIFKVINNSSSNVFDIQQQKVVFGQSASIVTSGATAWSGTVSNGSQILTFTNGMITNVE